MDTIDILFSINFSKNKITSLPKEISQLKNLKTLNLKNNKITSLPKEIGNLERLENLLLNSNDLETIPDEVSELKNLQSACMTWRGIFVRPRSHPALPGGVFYFWSFFSSPWAFLGPTISDVGLDATQS